MDNGSFVFEASEFDCIVSRQPTLVHLPAIYMDGGILFRIREGSEAGKLLR